MSKKLATLALGMATALIPAVAFANTSILDEINDGIDELSTMDSSLIDFNDAMIARGAGGPGHQPGHGPGAGPRPHGPAHHPAPRPRAPRMAPPPPRHVYVHPHSEVVVVTQPATRTVVEEEQTVTVSEKIGSTFGIGLRVLGSKVSDYVLLDDGCDENYVAPGIGWYMKFRPSRWISIELYNDYLFAENNYNEISYRVPFYAGLQGHIFDYGDLDVYLAAAGGLTLTAFDEFRNSNDTYVQWGGQFGGGVSVLLGAFELGLDIRYTLEEAPGDHYYDGRFIEYDQSQIVHGVNFALTLGFGI